MEGVGEAVARPYLGRLDLDIPTERAQPALQMTGRTTFRVAARDPRLVGRQAVYLT